MSVQESLLFIFFFSVVVRIIIIKKQKTKSSCGKKTYFDLWLQRNKCTSWQGSMTAGIGGWEITSLWQTQINKRNQRKQGMTVYSQILSSVIYSLQRIVRPQPPETTWPLWTKCSYAWTPGNISHWKHLSPARHQPHVMASNVTTITVESRTFDWAPSVTSVWNCSQWHLSL